MNAAWPEDTTNKEAADKHFLKTYTFVVTEIHLST